MKLMRLLQLICGVMLLSSCSILLPEGREASRLRRHAEDLEEHLNAKNEELAKVKERRSQLEGQIKQAKRQIVDVDKQINRISKARKNDSKASLNQLENDKELIDLQSLKAKREEELRKAEQELQFTY